MQTYKPRYGGARWTIIYGAYDGIERVALNKLNMIAQRHLPYVIKCVPADGYLPEKDTHLILIGTPANNTRIAELIRTGRIALSEKHQAYTIACMNSPWTPGRLIVIAGRDETGVLYGTMDFDARILPPIITPEKQFGGNLRKAFDSLADFTIQEHPLIENRGIWTWGYVIYDYRRFINNMARLKMNMLTIWNDCPPLNIRDIIRYAHERGVKIVLGFQWGWGMEFDVFRAADRQRIKDMVLREYETHYSELDMDGIYFQTLTEHNQTEIGGKSVAGTVCEMVNGIVADLLKAQPGLNIQFGLHATSIRDRYTDLTALDPRVTITWEDAGVLPFTYTPETNPKGVPEGLATFEQTLEYSIKLATFRKGTTFAMVPKGWTCLDWKSEFEHHGPFILGERDPQFISERLAVKQPHWDKTNTLWLKNYRLALRFYSEILKCRPKSITVTGLIEDGLFEERIQPSVALFAETIWNPERDPDEILKLAQSPAYARY